MSDYIPARRERAPRERIVRPCVVTPSFRGGEYLRLALESLAAQTMDFRLILLDTSGEGRAERVLREMPLDFQRKVTFEHFPPMNDAGHAAGSRLMELWGGEDVLCRLHDDDALHPRRLADSAAFLEAHPEVDIAFCGQVGFDDTHAPKDRISYVDPTSWGWSRATYRPINSATSMHYATALEVPYPDGYVSGLDDVLWHARWWAAGLGIASVPNTPHYYRRRHHGGQFGNSCSPVSVPSEMGLARLGREAVEDEARRIDTEFETMRVDANALHEQYGAHVWFVAPGLYEVEGVGLVRR